MDDSTWEEHFKGYTIIDCVIPNDDRIAFLLKEDPAPGEGTVDDNELMTRIVVQLRDEEAGEDWVYQDMTNARGPKLTYGFEPGLRLLTVSVFGEVFVLGGGEAKPEKDIPVREGIAIGAAAHVAGAAYVAGSGRTVLRRDRADRWTALNGGLGRGDEEVTMDEGFNALDGYGPEEMYAAGGAGDLWRFDGSRWHRIELATNVEINDLCCGEDGLVYLVGDGGTLIAGRGDVWAQVEQDVEDDALDSIAWYDGRAWISTSSRLYEFSNGKLERVEVRTADNEVQWTHAVVATGGGLLISAGPKDAFAFDGREWHCLVPNLEVEEMGDGDGDDEADEDDDDEA
jgi:hypothetical protein